MVALQPRSRSGSLLQFVSVSLLQVFQPVWQLPAETLHIIVLIDMPRRRWGAPFFPGTTLRRNWSGRGAERRIFCPFRFDFGGVAGHSGASLRSSGCCKAGPYVQERHLERGGEWNEAKGRPYHDVSEKSTSYIREKMRNFVGTFLHSG